MSSRVIYIGVVLAPFVAVMSRNSASNQYESLNRSCDGYGDSLSFYRSRPAEFYL